MPKRNTSNPQSSNTKISARDAFLATAQDPLRASIHKLSSTVPAQGSGESQNNPAKPTQTPLAKASSSAQKFGPWRNHMETTPQNEQAVRASRTKMTKMPDGTYVNHDPGIPGTPIYQAIASRPGKSWKRVWDPEADTTTLHFDDGKSMTFRSARSGGKLLRDDQVKFAQMIARQKADIRAAQPSAATNAFGEIDAAPGEMRQSGHYLGGVAKNFARSLVDQSAANRQINQQVNPLLPRSVRDRAAAGALRNINSSSKNAVAVVQKSIPIAHAMVGGPGGMGDTLAKAGVQVIHGNLKGAKKTMEPVPGNILKYSKEQPLHQVLNGVALVGGVVGVAGKTGALAGRFGEAANGAADVADAAGNTTKASVLRTTARIAEKTSKILAPPRKPQVVVHLTNQTDGPRIVENGKIGTRIGVYGLAGNRVPKPGKLRNVLSQVRGDLSYDVPITGDAANVFRSPFPWGPNSLYRNLAGIKRAPLGSINLKTHQFIPNEVFDKATKTFRPATFKDHLLYNGHVFTAEYLNDLLFYGGIGGYNGIINHFDDQSRKEQERGEAPGVTPRKRNGSVKLAPATRRSNIKRY